MDSVPYIAGSTFLSAFNALVEKGIPVSVIEDKIGMKREELEDPDFRLPVPQWNKFLELGVTLSGNPAFALQLGEQISHEKMSLVGHVVFNSRTVGEGIQQYARFIKLANEGDLVVLRKQNDEVMMVYETENPEYYSPLAMERNFSVAITRLRRYTATKIPLKQVHFQHSAPNHINEYQRIFQGPILFDQTENKLVFDHSILSLKIRLRSSHLYTALHHYAESLLNKLSLQRPFQKRVQQFIVKYLPEGEVDIEKISHLMNMSRQTLYRKLKEEGTNFHELLDETRKTFAVKYLKQHQYSINEIAFLLGFSETSAFSRAFKRWYQKSPANFRKK